MMLRVSHKSLISSGGMLTKFVRQVNQCNNKVRRLAGAMPTRWGRVFLARHFFARKTRVVPC
ncbi:MAG: hypothetical protein KatS3mg111_4254 [Pirellulaceae bacterium]|nr:MAG: hypothetical protein KatS3mg111_4254 [Pirellulaceae bacterium]